jgi:hypothetical protein
VSPPAGNDGGPAARTGPTTTFCEVTRNPYATASQQVSWWAVHEFVGPGLALQALPWPIVGTPAWCALDDADPRKLAAVLDAAQHWALHLETGQQASGDASRELSGAVDWSALAQRYRTHREFYAARPWLKRATS